MLEIRSPFIHRKGCERVGYDRLEYFMSTVAVYTTLTSASHLNPVDADDVRSQSPDIVAQIEADMKPAVDQLDDCRTSMNGISELLAPFAARGRRGRRS